MEKFLPASTIAFLQQEIAGNSFERIAIAVLVFFGILLAVKIFRGVVIRRLRRVSERTSTTWDDTLVDTLSGISNLFFLVLALFLTTALYLRLPDGVERAIHAIFLIIFAIEALKVLRVAMNFWLERSALGKNKTSLQGIKLIANIVLWVIGAALVLSNLGIDISALVASIGIGGIAIALAAQNLLGDLFASFSIYFDKPFQVGDYIVLGAHEGTVKKIGLKTTRIAALRGEELVISNKELTESRVQNFKKMKSRRVDFQVGVTYDTPAKKLEKIPELIASAVDAVELANFDRAHLHHFNDSSLGFEIVYFVLTGKKTDQMDAQQAINLGIIRAFEKEKIEMAFPTQTVYVKK